ncbi:uncharacterized protein [Anabrus simplex]|uniref:uncharacterized protein n=1 Tax=Anabrus simplex TaxID=316456 RepID=UPI0034DD727B
MLTRFLILTVAAAAVSALPPQLRTGSIWKGTPLEDVVDVLKKDCKKDMDSIACMKFKLLSLVDEVLRKESFKVSDNVMVVRNYEPTPGESRESRSDDRDFLDSVENYIETHDVLFRVPTPILGDATITMSPRRLDEGELSLTVQLDESRGPALEEGRSRRKSKLKKILIPVIVFVMLKAMTLTPLFIGMLGLKAWNALQLSFFSFVISVGLAIFHLCRKLSTDVAPQFAAHSAWDPHLGRRSIDSQTLAYRAHAQDS